MTRASAKEVEMLHVLFIILLWAVFGFIVGLVARAVYPGAQQMSATGTMALGIVGSFVGGLFANLLFGNGAFAFRAAGFVGSILGALAVLMLMRVDSRARV